MSNPVKEGVPTHRVTVFTKKLREEFRGKRVSLYLDYVLLGRLLHIHWTTVRNWETGRVKRCHPRNVRRLRDFLSGRLDDQVARVGAKRQSRESISETLLHQFLLTCQKIHLEYLDLLSRAVPQKAEAFLEALKQSTTLS